jgi:hypothetical protein
LEQENVFLRVLPAVVAAATTLRLYVAMAMYAQAAMALYMILAFVYIRVVIYKTAATITRGYRTTSIPGLFFYTDDTLKTGQLGKE